MGRGDTLVNAVIGVLVSILTSFTGVGPLFGGLAAGYLQRESAGAAVWVGALSGLLSLLPFALLLVIVGGLLPFVPGLAAVAGVFLFVVIGVFGLYTVGLSAVGGYLGRYLETNDVV